MGGGGCTRERLLAREPHGPPDPFEPRFMLRDTWGLAALDLILIQVARAAGGRGSAPSSSAAIASSCSLSGSRAELFVVAFVN
mmetsp:Transcript_24475/g.61961  ORF Transcript_24475/g.61961 Transcript_24475/m.61961 type:complete len:83 (-) Transcript_24475:78-326(-)